MRTVALLFVCAIVALGQTPPAPKLFAAAGDVTAMIAKAKAERKPDQANFIQPIVRLAPYNANLEYRVGSVAAPASVHETEAELFYVVEGTGTMVTGGKLVDEKRTNASNLSGTKIEGGESRTLSKGDFLIVPAGTPHWITGIDGALALMTLHLPVK
jgi:mannose-6-phosphate isomerase-like protein (cupin superfamily)